MVKHIILWQLKDELSDAEKAAVKAGIKEGLEGLVGKVPGLLEVHVNINGLPTSNADVMLDTTLESFEALKGYAVHPAHVAVPLHQDPRVHGLRGVKPSQSRIRSTAPPMGELSSGCRKISKARPSGELSKPAGFD